MQLVPLRPGEAADGEWDGVGRPPGAARRLSGEDVLVEFS